jgi:hypothetical protein
MPFVSAEFQNVKGERRVIYTDEKGDRVAYIGGTPAWRNNNPGNLISGAFSKRHKAIGSDGKFAIFPDSETGRKAKEALIENNWPDYTVRQMLKGVTDEKGKLIQPGYAPKSDGNDPDKYAEDIRKATKIDVDKTKIKDLTDEQKQGLFKTMRKTEGAIPGKIQKLDAKGNPIADATWPELQPRHLVAEIEVDSFSEPSVRQRPMIHGKWSIKKGNDEGLV